MVKNPPANAEDMGFIAGPGRSHMARGKWTHVPQLLSPTLEPTGCNSWACRPQYWSLWLQSPGATTGEAMSVRSLCTATKSSPCLLQLHKACKQQWRTSTGKKKYWRLYSDSLGVSPAWLCQLDELLNLLYLSFLNSKTIIS